MSTPGKVTLEQLLARTLILDLEPLGSRIELGICHGEHRDRVKVGPELGAYLQKVLARSPEIRVVMGHNVIEHDLPILRDRAPESPLHRLPAIDTLWLSPLAFPEHPYHRLIKGYKLVRSAASNPVEDALLSRQLFLDEWRSLEARGRERPDSLSFYRYCFAASADHCRDRGAHARLLELLGAAELGAVEAGAALAGITAERCCTNALERLWQETSTLAEKRRGPRLLALAYVAAWIPVAGSSSVLPHWVRRRHPEVPELVHRLRQTPCGDRRCSFCTRAHDPRHQLKRFFSFEEFRTTPATADGASLQEAIVADGMAGGSHLALLPTGAGKSLCFQLPALVRGWQRGCLTIVISPLQALMRDQVENLNNKTTPRAAALYGLLTPLERGRVLREIEMGDVTLLYIAPEQLRNRSFRRAVVQREIGAWVFDEAHCLSKWGHDFRPDYLYACRAIQEIRDEQEASKLPPVVCFTATAKEDVKREILEHFRAELGIELRLFDGGVERQNLRYSVEPVTREHKSARVAELVEAELRRTRGSVIVYCSRRRATEQMAEHLSDFGLPVAHFHAGLNPAHKRDVLDRFLSGEIRVICATNAFGMGVDKPDVRLVVHADIPGTLENYLQEAGRAGRDLDPSHCVLLFSESDVEDQFDLVKRSEVSHTDMVQILRGLRRAGRRDGGEEFHITSGELLRDEQVETSFDTADGATDTRVKTAVSWLERSELIERNLNQTSVFSGKPEVQSVAEAEPTLDRLGVRGLRRRMWLSILERVINLSPDDGLTVDDIAGLPAFQIWYQKQPEEARSQTEISTMILGQLREMCTARLLKQGTLLTAFLRYKVPRPSPARLQSAAHLEEALLQRLPEEAPDAEDGSWQALSLRRLNHALREEDLDVDVVQLRTALKSLSPGLGAVEGSRVGLVLRERDRDRSWARLQGDWPQLVRLCRARREVARVCLEALLAKVPKQAPPSAELLVEFSIEDLVAALRNDLVARAQLREDLITPVEHGLLFLHDHGALILQRGLAIFRSAMSIRLVASAKGRRYTQRDYEPLREHYDQRTAQVHVMRRYAELGLEDARKATDFVLRYFELDSARFIERYLPGQGEAIKRPLGAPAHRQIVDDLRNETQQAVVTAPAERSQLVLAGPGSGKTRVVVHRCAYLLRVLRVPRSSVLVLCFNRSTALELRRRLRDLLGGPLGGLAIHTYDGLAMRIAGRCFAGLQSAREPPPFDQVREEACELLEGKRAHGGLEPDELRERLLQGYRFILVDEYQDIDESQYRLVSAIAGRTLSDKEAKLSILAVGDDDQNIYSWRGSSIRFIQQFERDYDATRYSLLDNYRSTRHIVEAGNQVIGHNRRRMKSEPIRVDSARAQDPPGGPMEALDPDGRGRVRRLHVGYEQRQSLLVLDELRRMGRVLPELSYDSVAVLAAEWRLLGPLRARCQDAQIPVRWAQDDPPPTWRLRETVLLREQLQLDAVVRGALSAAMIRAALEKVRQRCGPSRWVDYLEHVLAVWEEEYGTRPQPRSEFREFLAETLLEERRLSMAQRGVFLGTVHAAKGLEFDHVFLLDGGWTRCRHEEDDESSRRTYYVGMTRARKELVLLRRHDEHSSFPREIQGACVVDQDRQPERVRESTRDPACHRLDTLSLRDLYLNFAGRRGPGHPVHRALAGLRDGSRLLPRSERGWYELVDPVTEIAVAALSKEAKRCWGPRKVLEARVTGLARWRKEDSTPEHQSTCQVDSWEVPLVEMAWDDKASAHRQAR